MTGDYSWLVTLVTNTKDTHIWRRVSMTDFSVSGPYGMYHAVIIVKGQFLSNGVLGSLSDSAHDRSWRFLCLAKS